MVSDAQDLGAPARADRAFIPSGSSPAVSPVPVSIPNAVCPTCGGPSRFEGRCMACIADDYEDDYEANGCYECGGEGFVSDCVEEWACVDPEYGCDYCTRPCPLCNSSKPTPKEGE